MGQAQMDKNLYGSCDNLTPFTISELLEVFVKELGRCTGGDLHIVLDEMNIEDRNIKYCFIYMLNYGNYCPITHDLIMRLYLMDRDKRLKVCKQFQKIAGYPNA